VETLYRAGLSNAVSATLLALVVACLGRVLARRPAVLHCLWLLVLLKLVTPPLYEVSIPWPEPSTSAEASASASAAIVVERGTETAEPSDLDDVVLELHAPSVTGGDTQGRPLAGLWLVDWSAIDWMRLACLIWLGGTVTTLVVSITRILRFQRLLRASRPADLDTQDWVDQLAASLGLDRAPSVWWTEGKLPPLVWSLGRQSRMIIPTALWKGLGEKERSTLIIHELAHLCRGDHHVRILELLVTALYWWHPVLWWARQALHEVEEQCCDAWVVWSCPDAARSYAETLLETLDFLNQSDLTEPLMASGFGRVHHLRKRLTMIMSGNTPRLVGLWGTLGSLGLGVLLLPVNATWAQKPEEPQEVKIVVKTDDAAKDIALAEADVITAVVAAAGTSEDAKANEFKFEFKTDDSPAIVAGSVDDAIKKVKQQLDSIRKEAHPSDKVLAKKKALERVVAELEKVAKSDKDDKSVSDKQKVEKSLRQVIVRQVEDNKKLTAEQKAEIEKATALVKKLADEVRSKQKELVEAKTKLAKLSTATRRKAVLAVAGDGRLKELPAMAKKPLGVISREVTIRPDAPAGQKRIDDLEKKLEKLLEEVASLKKDRAQ
jgi:bla regulator protein blaR1